MSESGTIDDAELDRLADRGFDWIWMLSVWQTGLAAQKVSRTNPEWRHESNPFYARTLEAFARACAEHRRR